MTVTNNIYQKQIEYHVFNAVTNSELTELVPVFTTRPAFPTSVKKVNTSFKNVWRRWGPALPTLLADLMIFCPLRPIGPTNFKNSEFIISLFSTSYWNYFYKHHILCTFYWSFSKKTSIFNWPFAHYWFDYKIIYFYTLFKWVISLTTGKTVSGLLRVIETTTNWV